MNSATDMPMYERRGKLALVASKNVRRIVVAGDIHGDLRAFKRVLSLRRQDDLVIFLGDYADRGPSGLEVLEGLMKVSGKPRNGVLPLKGNHEDFSEKGDPLFNPCTLISEAMRKGRDWKDLFPLLHSFFDSLPIAVLIPGFALLVHGGITEEILTRESLENPSPRIAKRIIWSDPAQLEGQHASPRGAGVHFGPDITAKVLGSLGVKFQIGRAHV